MIVNELTTNATKYAYTHEAGGKIFVEIGRNSADAFSISVSDQGAGLPIDFDLRKAKGLGMRIVSAFAKQLNADIEVRSRNPGTQFIISIPLDDAP